LESDYRFEALIARRPFSRSYTKADLDRFCVEALGYATVMSGAEGILVATPAQKPSGVDPKPLNSLALLGTPKLPI